MRIKYTENYVKRRLEAYPPIGDQLDAIWKGGDAADAMRQKILAVKDAFPKPAKPANN